jgi:hypothetical protein
MRDFDIIKYLLKNENMPSEIGKYSFKGSRILSDGALQIYYRSDDDKFGHFTLTIYNRGLNVPTGYKHSIIDEEFDVSKYDICMMEEIGEYRNIGVILEEPFILEESTDYGFASLLFVYEVKLATGGYLKQFSVLLLRADFGYFHKIRYSIDIESFEENMENFGEFLQQWSNFFNSLGIVN